MKTIAHLSDLHFGTEEAELAERVLADLAECRPDAIVVSGDLTQRARRGQFKAAREFLDRLPAPCLVVPGNHDIPLFHVWRRFFSPLTHYRNIITPELNPMLRSEGLFILGLNTARSFTWKNGRISEGQMLWMETQLRKAGGDVFKIVVTHHPFIPPPGQAGVGIELVGRAAQALEVIDRGGVDLLLAGHLHEGYTGDIRTHYPHSRRSIIVAQAGTAISRRVRTTPNAWNLLHVARDRVIIESRVWKDRSFVRAAETGFVKKSDEWVKV